MLEEEHPEINVHVFNSCSAVSGEGFVNVFRGSGRVLMSPL